MFSGFLGLQLPDFFTPIPHKKKGRSCSSVFPWDDYDDYGAQGRWLIDLRWNVMSWGIRCFIKNTVHKVQRRKKTVIKQNTSTNYFFVNKKQKIHDTWLRSSWYIIYEWRCADLFDLSSTSTSLENNPKKTHRQIQASRVRCTRRRSAAMAERTRHHCCPGCRKSSRKSKLVWHSNCTLAKKRSLSLLKV